jgi:hypothetical protein
MRTYQFYDAFFENKFFKHSRLVISTHPYDEKMSRDLLGEELLSIAKVKYKNFVPNYSVYQMSGAANKRRRCVIIEPSVHRWLSWVQDKMDPLIFEFINNIYRINPDKGWLALFGNLIKEKTNNLWLSNNKSEQYSCYDWECLSYDLSNLKGRNQSSAPPLRRLGGEERI